MELAREIGTTKPVFFAQGWGPQRQANGEQTSRAIAMLPILTGNVGLPGTSTGQHEGNTSFPVQYLPSGKNPVKATIPCFLWTDAITRGAEMDAIHDGLKGVEKLTTPIKMIVNSGGNTMINQHADSNATDKILRDTSKCEFIVVCDNMMTLVGPLRRHSLSRHARARNGRPRERGRFERRRRVVAAHEEGGRTRLGAASDLGHLPRDRQGVGPRRSLHRRPRPAGLDRVVHEETRKKYPTLPDFKTFWAQGPQQVYGVRKNMVALSEFREDPVKNPL